MTDLKRIKRITLGTMCFALFMVMLDSTVVNLALPTIQRELGAGMSELQWIVDAFVLALASLLLTDVDGARLFQGVGGAMMMPSTLSILTNTFPDARERARAIGIWAGVSGLSLAIGPLVGGWLVDNFGWQSIFWINVPIGLVAIALALRFVPESSDRAGRGLDLAGQITAVVGLAALTYAFIEANTYGWTSARILTIRASAPSTPALPTSPPTR